MNLFPSPSRWVAAWKKVAARPNLPLVLVVLALALTGMIAWLRPEASAGGAIAITTLVVTRAFDLLKRRSEEQRWHAQPYLQDKLDRLRALAAAYYKWRRELNYFGNFTPQDLQEFQRALVPLEQEFMQAFGSATVYLPEDVEAILSRAMGTCRQAQMAIYYSIPGHESQLGAGQQTIRNFPWETFITTGNATASALRPLLYPQSLRDIEVRLADGRGF
jgi:hypothetical protein